MSRRALVYPMHEWPDLNVFLVEWREVGDGIA
jgi:hypothetical protein